MLSLDDRLKAALAEDMGRGDITTLSTVAAETQAQGVFKLKMPGVVSALGVATRVFELVDPQIQVKWLAKDGDVLPVGTLGEISGPARSILIGERVALNLMQRMSGIATLTHAYARELAGTKTKLLDTRKTTPLWRDLEKAAVLHGGGQNHRLGLDDGVLIKDNHIVAAGGILAAIAGAKTGAYLLKVLCEVTSLEELTEALQAGADRIMLDNFDDEALIKACEIRDQLASYISLEVSGGVTLERLKSIANSGADYVSVGALTHSSKSLDISLDFQLSSQ